MARDPHTRFSEYIHDPNLLATLPSAGHGAGIVSALFKAGSKAASTLAKKGSRSALRAIKKRGTRKAVKRLARRGARKVVARKGGRKAPAKKKRGSKNTRGGIDAANSALSVGIPAVRNLTNSLIKQVRQPAFRQSLKQAGKKGAISLARKGINKGIRAGNRLFDTIFAPTATPSSTPGVTPSLSALQPPRARPSKRPSRSRPPAPSARKKKKRRTNTQKHLNTLLSEL